MRTSKLISLIVSFILLGCSSSPPTPTSVNLRKNMAADNLKYGNNAYDQGDYTKALQFFLLALEHNTAADFEEGLIKSYHSLSKTFLALGQLEKARSMLESARRILQFYADNGLKAQQQYHQANLLLEEGKIDQAFQTMTEALTLNQNTTDQAQRAVILHGMGMVKRARAISTNNNELLTEALKDFQAAQKINESLPSNVELATNHYMQGMVYLRLNVLDQARFHLQTALELDRKMEISFGIAMDHRALGMLATKENNWNVAADHYLRSYRIFLVLSLPEQQKRALDLLIEALTKANKKEEAEIFKQERSRLDA